MQKLVLFALATFSTAAGAGYHYWPEVSATFSKHHHHTYAIGYGSLTGAASSTDENQSINCSASSRFDDPDTSVFGLCIAVDKDGYSVSCYTTDLAMIAPMLSVNESSLISFEATDGICDLVSITNGSQGL
jgi:hypothetical protein